ncbi:MAG: hypothetical protein LUH05_08975 [Candidatus Gastranaerophilales bacterium]|nr:hypothetical protein [Candidatus Gastranaerophilales bacterium]
MDISGVDVDNLSDKEILDLCSDIVDCSNDEISVLKGIDVNNLSDDKTQELYENILFGENKREKIVYLTDKQVLDSNYNTVDADFDEIALLNGYNINNLSEEEILALYNGTMEVDNNSLIADIGYFSYNVYYCYNFTAYLYTTTFTCKTAYGINVYMVSEHVQYGVYYYSSTYNSGYKYQITYDIAQNPGVYGSCNFQCDSYMYGKIYCYTNLHGGGSTTLYRYLAYSCK